MSFHDYLGELTADELCGILERRPDVLVEPAPRSIGELAQRLGGIDSLARAMPRTNRDEFTIARAVALHDEPTLPTLAGRLGASERAVSGLIDRLAGRGLAWRAGDRVGLPARLAEHLAAEVAAFRPLRLIAAQARVDDLRTAVHGLGGDPAGLRKPELIAQLGALVSDPRVVAAAVARLTPAARRRLDVLCQGSNIYFGSTGYGPNDPIDALTAAGLLIAGPYHQGELPRECAVTLLASACEPITGPPTIPMADDLAGERADDGRAGAESLLRALTNLLDESRRAPLAALKKGGVGVRERTRLATRVGVTEPALCIDLAHSTGLLSACKAGYRATSEYDTWREEDPGPRWSRAALGWFALDIAPTSRQIDDDTEVAPPLPLHSAAGMVRRALLRAAAGGRSLSAAAEHLDWYCPLHSYDETGLALKLDAALAEGRAVGLVGADRLTGLGELLVAVADRADARDELARRAAALLPASRGTVVLQSDLTAIVSGQPDAAAARLLAVTATAETVGTATIWRFSPASIRAALDAGHQAEDLRAGLAGISRRPLPQPLDYLITDVARHHGSVRLRGARCCVTGAEADVAEILATRSLRPLHLSRLAPTVLTSPFDLDKVLPALRKAGFAPMPEDADGVVIVPADPAPAETPAKRPVQRRRVSAVELANRLIAGKPSNPASSNGASSRGEPAPVSGTHAELAELAPRLDDAEIALLVDALEHGRDIRITYRNKAGNRTVRDIRPQQLYGRWLSSWCHLRAGEREFTVSGIETVAPVG